MPDNPTRPWYMAGDEWTLLQEGEAPERTVYFETILSQANGYMGVRAYTEEPTPGVTSVREGYLAGVFSEVDEEATRIINGDFPWPVLEMVSLPDLFHTRLRLNGHEFAPQEGTVDEFRRHLDLRTGLLVRELLWTAPDGCRTRLRFERFLSAANPHLACQRVTVEPLDWDGEIVVERQLDGDAATVFRCGDKRQPEWPHHHFQDFDRRTRGELGLVGARTRTTDHDVAVVSAMPGATTEEGQTATDFVQRTILRATRARGVASERFCAVVTSRDDLSGDAAVDAASALAEGASTNGFDGCLAASSAVWSERWKAALIEIEGAPQDNKVVRYNVFQLLQMAPFHSEHLSLPARAYAFNRYRGLYFWDTEIFLLPFYQWVLPQVARNLLAFRYHTLPGARKNAEHWGGQGALFPWMTDSETGLDNSIDARVWKLFHQAADIAYAVDQYARASGDDEFMRRQGVEILIEVARFFASRFVRESDGYWHLEQTIGPDEDREPGKDNGFTCLMARRALRLAANWSERLAESANEDRQAPSPQAGTATDEEIRQWRAIADGIHIPNVPETDIPLQDEFFMSKKVPDVLGWNLRGPKEDWKIPPGSTKEYRLIKQADIVLATFLLEDEFTPDQVARTFDFYEPLTVHASSLSWNTHAIVAARLGRREQAYDYYLRSAGLDLDDVLSATADGLHAAALGGGWQTVVLGFCGLRKEGNEAVCVPNLPPSWRSVRFRFRANACLQTVAVNADGSWEIAPDGGAAGAT